MNLESVFYNLPEHHKHIIKSSLATESVQILFTDAMLECESKLGQLSTELQPEAFKLRYLEVKKSILAYDSILTLITKLKQGELK
jgi:hypothetical protein